jgi:CRP-like cAMP-binding protein
MFIKEIDLFEGFSERFIDEIAKIMVEESYGEGSFLFKEGDPANDFYVLEEGSIRLAIGEEGHITYTSNAPGDSFGWSSLVDRDVYTTSAQCAQPTKVIKIEKGKLQKIFDKDRFSGLMFYKRLARIIGDRLINNYNSLLSVYRGEGPPSYG